MTAPGLDARGVVVSLGGRVVLTGVDVHVAPGRVTGLLGPSGSGKSTLLRACVRLVEIDDGTITLDGEDVRTLDARLLLLDEPTSALDHDVAEHVGATLRRLADRGLGICIATHDRAFADRWLDRRVELT